MLTGVSRRRGASVSTLLHLEDVDLALDGVFAFSDDSRTGPLWFF